MFNIIPPKKGKKKTYSSQPVSKINTLILMFIYIHVHGTVIHWHNVRLAFSTYFSFTFTIVSVD